MKLIDLTRINQLVDEMWNKINAKYATKTELNSGLKGKAEVDHGTHLTLGDTQNNAYRGDYGNAAYQHSQAAHAPSNAQKNSDITKAEIEAKLTGTITSHTHSGDYAAESHTHNHLEVKNSNTITSTTNDTTANWGAQKTSIHWYSATGQLTDQPAQWGYLLNVGHHSEVHQLWMTQASGDLKHRGGNTSGWNGTWRTLLDSSNFNTHVTPSAIGAAAASHGNHVPATQTASNKVFLRNDNTWQTITPENIGAAAASHGTHVSYDTNAPKAAGTAAVGASANVARADHVHPAQTTITGNAGSATKVNNNLVVKLNGGSTEETNLFTFNGSTAKTVNITASNIGAAPSSSIGTLSSLKTSAKGDLVSAINELFQSANNGKQLIANAIGDSSITSNSTFNAMGNAITDKKDRLYNLMLNGGYEVNSSMNMDRLLEILELSGISANDIKQVACGNYHTLILKYDGSVYSSGNNNSGQLGLGTSSTTYVTFNKAKNINNDVKQIACGANHTFILKKDGSVWSCGNNESGQLGLGDNNDKISFTKVTTNISNDVKQIACGYEHTVILKNDGSVWACGSSTYGQLGLGSSGSKTSFTKVTTNVNNDIKQVACGAYSTFIIKNDGSVWACGDNDGGRLGLSDTTKKTTFTKVTANISNDVKQIASGGSHTVILKNDGSVWACGYNNNGQLGLGDTTNRATFTKVTTNVNNDVKQVACGAYNTFILKNDGSVWACGNGFYGQLGLGNTNNKTKFTKVTTNINNDVKEIACGYEHTVILKNDDSVWGCGYNGNGQLGLSTSSNSYTSFTNIPRGL